MQEVNGECDWWCSSASKHDRINPVVISRHTGMPYDHSTKIGNQGDLVKHVALFAALQRLLDDWSGSNEFVYADIHAGRPQYVLPEKGNWRQGIGAFSASKSVTADRKEREKRRSALGCLGEFDDCFIGRRLATGMIYPGSSGIAFRVLREEGIRFRMKVWDKNPAAADDLVRYFLPWQERVTVVCGDGYEGIKENAPLTFVLIDPPAPEHDAVLRTMAWLKRRKANYICWTPRSSQEKEDSRGYFVRAREVGDCFGVKWGEWRIRKTRACYITVAHAISEVVEEALRQVAKIMEWELETNGATPA